MMLIPSRLLVFDEPTNHLDVPMKDADDDVTTEKTLRNKMRDVDS